VLPTYAFFNDTFKDHLETEYEQVVELVTNPLFIGMFEPNEQINIDKNISWVLDNAEFLYDFFVTLSENARNMIIF
jgi:hypothetical protein